MPTAASEIKLIELFAKTKVIGLTINHEGMSDDDVEAAIALYGLELGIPVTDALWRSGDLLVEMVLASFPSLQPGASLDVHGAPLEVKLIFRKLLRMQRAWLR